MMETQNENRIGRKFWVPVIALILLGLGLSGAVYAYSSSVSVNGNLDGIEYLAIDFRNGDSSDIVPVDISEAIVFADDYVYSDIDSKQLGVHADVVTKKIYTCNLKVGSNCKWNTVKVTSTDIGTLLAKTVDTGAALSTVFRIYVNVNNDTMLGAKELMAEGAGEASFSVAKVTELDNVTVYVYIVAMDGETPLTTIGATGSTTVRNLAEITDQNYHDANYFRSLFSTAEYRFTFSFHAAYV